MGDPEKKTALVLAYQMKKWAIRPQNVILSVPRYAAVFKNFKLPSKEKEEIAQMVKLRVLRETGVLKENDFVYDHQVTGYGEDGQAFVSVFLMKKSRLLRYVNILRKAGIAVSRVTLSTQGLMNWSALQEGPKKSSLKSTFLLNVDDGLFDFNVAFGGRSVYSRTFRSPQASSGQDYYSFLEKELKLSLEWSRCIRGRGLEDGDRLYATGLIKELDERFSIQKISPIANCEVGLLDKNVFIQPRVSYASVIGLALSEARPGIDLTPPELSFQQKQGMILKFWRLGLAGLIFIFSLWSVVIFPLAAGKIEELDGLRGRLRTFSSLEKALAKAVIKERIEKEVLKNPFFPAVFSEFGRVLPDGVSIESLDLKERQASWEGEGPDLERLLKVAQALNSSTVFQDVRLECRQDKERIGAFGVKYRLDAVLS
jgi:hypothetical protein